MVNVCIAGHQHAGIYEKASSDFSLPPGFRTSARCYGVRGSGYAQIRPFMEPSTAEALLVIRPAGVAIKPGASTFRMSGSEITGGQAATNMDGLKEAFNSHFPRVSWLKTS